MLSKIMIKAIRSSFVLVNSFINNGHSRSVRAKQNIIASVFLKGLSISISLFLIPLTINYINPTKYGIWLTISSIVGWFGFFDIGLTQGLRNKFAEAKAKGNDSLAQTYISTTYAILISIFSLVWIIFLCSNFFLNWSAILNISGTMESEVSTLVVIVFTYFCLQFVLRIITTIITADQQPAKASVIEVLGQGASLICIVVLVQNTQGSLIKLGLALCVSPLLVTIAATVYFFNGEYKKFRPSLSKIQFSSAKGLFNTGMIFFVIQVAGIIQFETANLIIARNFGTAEVTSYNIVYRYFGILNMVFAIFLTPFWSASTEAFIKNDIQWIKNGMKKYNLLNIALVGLGLIMLIFSERIYHLWLGKNRVQIDFMLSLWGFIFFAVSLSGSKYVYFLNGISALKIQFYTSIISPLLYVIVANILIRYFYMGVFSLFIASLVANLNAFLLAPLQYHMIINKGKKSIWIK